MGGCRCTYKNCTVRSDGKTHLFHYPVFDKVRCHEWLSKAGRYDFLNLKVSQLKNRCVCQHHFTDDWFMNDKKEKLKLQAIPTLDGPFCDASKFKTPGMPQNMMGVYPLACEVIEHEDFIDRKSNYNLVYADFLTNNEDTIKDFVSVIDAKEQNKNVTNVENLMPITDNNPKEAGYTLRSGDNKRNPQPLRPPASGLFVEVPAVIPGDQNHATSKQIVKTENQELPGIQNKTDGNKHNLPTQKKRSKVRIISEKKIIDPAKQISVPVTNPSFKVVKPSMILNINKNKADFNYVKQQVVPVPKNEGKSMLKELQVVPETDKVDSIMIDDMAPKSCQKDESGITELLTISDPSQFEIKMDIIETPAPTQLTPNQKKITKTKISPERMAAIKEKRMFNMKLKDIIAHELNRIEDHNTPHRNTLIPNKSNCDKLGTETVMSSLSNDPRLPHEHSYIVHYLEARMEKMENLLLQKVDQNTKKIMDLKRMLEDQGEKPPEAKDKSKMSEEAYKKHLFNEISQYLMPNSNNLIYEELFINKYDPIEHKAAFAPPTSKRKRNRR